MFSYSILYSEAPAVLTSLLITHNYYLKLFIAAFSEMDVMRLVLLDQLLRHYPLGRTPNEIHFRVGGAQREPRFEYKKHAAVQKKKSADQSHRHRQPRAATGGQATRKEESDGAD